MDAAMNGEPACADHLLLKPRANLSSKRCAFKTILVNCTTASPLAKDIKREDYKAETSGGLSYEARKYVKLLAKISNDPMGWARQRIYQELAAEIQNARANQVYITRNRYVTNTRPPPPTGTNNAWW